MPINIHNTKRWDRKNAYSPRSAVLLFSLVWGAFFVVNAFYPIPVWGSILMVIMTTWGAHYYFGIVLCMTTLVFGIVFLVLHTFIPHTLSGVALLVVFVVSLTGMWCIEIVRRMQYRLELVSLVSQSRSEMLQRQETSYIQVINQQKVLDAVLQHIAQCKEMIVMIQFERHQQDADAQPLTLMMMANSQTTGIPVMQVHDADRHYFTHKENGTIISVRMHAQGGIDQIKQCICQRFDTYLGTFYIWQLSDQ